MYSFDSSVKRPPLGVKLVAGYSLLVGFATFSLALPNSPLYLGVSVLAFAAAVGLWNGQAWGIGAGILLYLLDILRNIQFVLAGEMGLLKAVTVGLVVIVYLSLQWHSFR